MLASPAPAAARAAAAPPAARRQLCVGGVAALRRPLLARAAPSGPAGEDDYASVRQAAAYVADTYLSSGQVVGLGTGVAVNIILHELAERLGDGRLRAIRCVPSSDASASEAAFHGVPLTTLAEAGGVVDLLVDVASELDVGPSGGLSYIVGRGASGTQVAQPCLPRLRALLAAARRCVVVAEREEDCTGRLGGSLPVEVEGEGWEEAGEELDDVFIGDAEVWRRGAQEGAGPRGGDRPVLTAGGHQILDVRFAEGLKLFGEAAAYAEIAAAIEAVPGVVAHGLVAGRAAAAVVAGRDGPLAVAAHECMGAAAGEEA